MKNHNKMLVEFMKVKAKKLNEIEEGLGELYFTEEDEKDIMSWSHSEVEDIWEELRENVVIYDFDGLSSEVCPFCIKNDAEGLFNCNDCGYGIRHGECLSGNDDYSRIIRLVASKGVELSEAFSKGFYINLIESIERKYNEDD